MSLCRRWPQGGNQRRDPNVSCTMRRLVILIALVALSAGCGDDSVDVSSTGSAPSLADRTFVARDVVGHDLVPGTEIRITFEADQVQATAGCNHLFGQLRSSDDGILDLAGLGSTEMGCDAPRHDQDQWLIDFLSAGPRWTLEGDQLTLLSDSSEITLVDRVVADPDRPLEGTRWVLDSLISGPGPDSSVSSTPGQVEAYLVMADGEVEGHNGCNSIGGSYRVDGETLRFPERFSTLAGCLDPEVAAFEEAVMAVLDTTMTFEITADRLILTAPDGAGLGLHADE